MTLTNAGRCRDYYAEHREELLKKKADYRDAHRIELREKAAAYAREHKDEKATYDKDYYLAHREELLQEDRRWRKEHPGTRLAYNRRYYAELRKGVVEVYGDVCERCHRETDPIVLHHRHFDGPEERERLGGKGGTGFYNTYRLAVAHPDKNKYMPVCRQCHKLIHQEREQHGTR
jgi:hypothetical protein